MTDPMHPFMRICFGEYEEWRSPDDWRIEHWIRPTLGGPLAILISPSGTVMGRYAAAEVAAEWYRIYSNELTPEGGAA